MAAQPILAVLLHLRAKTDTREDRRSRRYP